MNIKTYQPYKEREIKKVPVLSLLVISVLVPCLISCSDFIDEKSPETPPVVKPPPTTPTPEPPKPPQTETEEQRNWRMCETERLWAFHARLIDADALKLYQTRNFAPAFKQPGERQSGIEGWYACKRALQLNGFIPNDVVVTVAPPTPQPSQTVTTPEPPKPAPPVETEEQRNWRLCEGEREWALNARLIDADAFRLFQTRNFAPVFNQPGERQSGIEGWYACRRALQANGFIVYGGTLADELAEDFL